MRQKTFATHKDHSYGAFLRRMTYDFHPLSPSTKSFLHVVAGSKTYLNKGRYTWRHNSALNFLASTFKYIKDCTLHSELPDYLLTCIITSDELCSDMIISTSNNTLYIIKYEQQCKEKIGEISKPLSRPFFKLPRCQICQPIHQLPRNLWKKIMVMNVCKKTYRNFSFSLQNTSWTKLELHRVISIRYASKYPATQWLFLKSNF